MKGFSPFTKREDGWRPTYTAQTEVSDIERKQERIDKKAAKGKDVSRKQERLDKRSERVYDRETARAERKERKADKKMEKGKGKQAARKQYKAEKIRETVSPLAKRSPYHKSEGNYDGGVMKQTYGTVSPMKKDDKEPRVARKPRKGPLWANPDGTFTEEPKRASEKAKAKRTPMKKNDKKIPKIKKKSPHDTVKMLENKVSSGTATKTDIIKLKKLKKSMERGPGSYGNERWDKE